MTVWDGPTKIPGVRLSHHHTNKRLASDHSVKNAIKSCQECSNKWRPTVLVRRPNHMVAVLALGVGFWIWWNVGGAGPLILVAQVLKAVDYPSRVQMSSQTCALSR